MYDFFDGFYRQRKVFITGHTGFKGTWLTRWLKMLGADVSGYALPVPASPNAPKLRVNMAASAEFLDDIRNFSTINAAVQKVQPEIVFHLAAQPIVRRSYFDPLETLTTNIIGTANLLEACRHCNAVRAVVVITTDKCYKNAEWDWAYREIDPLGGHDPYSASKACAELVAESYRLSFSANLATCRAGNVIGGGDWGEARIIPDLVRAALKDEITTLRNPSATRPWQHVLEPLRGYLMLGQRLSESAELQIPMRGSWNFGPDIEGNLPVGELALRCSRYWNRIRFQSGSTGDTALPHEANFLMLDSTKARHRLGWKPFWNIEITVQKTIEWYKAFCETGIDQTEQQIEEYCATKI